ncbi:MAG: pirin family protein [Deltaproteobacteria bacterium]|nr:MAG: pirin family protein [Deltaproteobacteria bacterium]
MIALRPAEERGHTRLSWLDSRHSFSFDRYYDPRHMGFRVLRVINEDRVDPGQGFGTHPHRDMEILTFVLEGALEHKDSLGSGSVIRPGDVQRMTAGTGISHSEFNPSGTEPVHFLQVWILPDQPGLAPSYEQRSFPAAGLRLVGSRDGREGSVRIHQDVLVHLARLSPGEDVVHALAPGRHAWIQMARGAAQVNGARLAAGDGAALSEERSVTLRGVDGAEALVFDLP